MNQNKQLLLAALMIAAFGVIVGMKLPGKPAPTTNPRRPKGREAVRSNPTVQPSPWVSEVFEVSAYCPCEKCCGEFADGITSSELSVEEFGGRFIAAPKRFKFGTAFRVPGYHNGDPVPVLDRGGDIKGQRCDVYYPDHKTALKFGRQFLTVQYAREN